MDIALGLTAHSAMGLLSVLAEDALVEEKTGLEEFASIAASLWPMIRIGVSIESVPSGCIEARSPSLLSQTT